MDVYGTYNYSYWGESKPTNITGGPHIVLLYPLHLLLKSTAGMINRRDST